MKSEHKDLLKLQTNAGDEQSKENSLNEEGQLLEKEMIDGTPFWCIGNRWDGYFLAFGQYRLGEVKNTKEEIIDYLNREMWTIIGYYISVITEIIVKELLEKQNEVANVEKVD